MLNVTLRYPMNKHTDDSAILPEWYAPCNMDVICSWARQNHQHVGNKRFRSLIDQYAPHYVKATTKFEKTRVIAVVIEKVRSESPSGGFVKKNFYSGRWYEIGDEKARDKVGHAIRKAAEELQRTKGIKSKDCKKVQKAAKKVSTQQKEKRLSSPDREPQGQKVAQGSAPNLLLSLPLPSTSNLYKYDSVAHSLGARPNLPQNQLTDQQIMPRMAGVSAFYRAPQTYLSNLHGLSVPESNRLEMQRSQIGGSFLGVGETSVGVAPASSGVAGSRLQAVVPSAPTTSSNSDIANRIAALRNFEIQQTISNAYTRANHETLLPQTGNGPLGTQIVSRTFTGSVPLNQLSDQTNATMESAEIFSMATRKSPHDTSYLEDKNV